MTIHFDQQAVKTLASLKQAIRRADLSGLRARIVFASTAYRCHLIDALRTHQLFDDHHICDRDLDTCFEMGDGDEVVHGVVDAARRDPGMQSALITCLGEETFQHWQTIYERIASGGNLAFEF